MGYLLWFWGQPILSQWLWWWHWWLWSYRCQINFGSPIAPNWALSFFFHWRMGGEINLPWMNLLQKQSHWGNQANCPPNIFNITFYPTLGASCQIGIEISDYTGDKISVGVARPSHVWGQSVPCDRWHSISGTRVQHVCTESGIRAQGLITRVTAPWQLSDNTGIRSTQLTLLLMRSMCSWLIMQCAAASTQYSY